jgi:hypothetical protein
MLNYKNHINQFFDLYSGFDFSQVISSYEGKTVSSFLYKSHTKFIFKGIYLPGPINQGVNCGNYWDNATKTAFVQLCKDSSKYFAEKYGVIELWWEKSSFLTTRGTIFG